MRSISVAVKLMIDRRQQRLERHLLSTLSPPLCFKAHVTRQSQSQRWVLVSNPPLEQNQRDITLKKIEEEMNVGVEEEWVVEEGGVEEQ